MRGISILILIMTACILPASGAVRYPAPLRPGDKVAILAPSGPVKKEYVDQSAEVIRELGYEPVVYPTAYESIGTFSARAGRRFADLKAALADPEVRAILCGRGGYGAVHLLDSLSTLDVTSDPKWLVGFSDISALHAFMASRGVASVHASMCSHLRLGPDDEENAYLFSILRGEWPEYEFEAHPYNHFGRAEGRLVGGNFAVLQALIDTPYDIIRPGDILFLEDVDEPVYKIERFLYQLKLAGVFDRLAGVAFGQFTEYKPDRTLGDMEEMIRDVMAGYPDLPVAFDLPIGHISHNVPVVESSHAVLDIMPEGVVLTMSPGDSSDQRP